MTKEEYQQLGQITKPEEIISVSDLANQEPRTLLWGYTTKRCSHHVYLKDGKMHLFVYEGRSSWDSGRDDKFYVFGPELPIKSLVPDKRLYPEACDAEFCGLLKEMGVYLPFTTWNNKRDPQQYHGEIIDV